MSKTPQQLLREARVRAGLTQAELGQRAGYSQQQVAKLEDESYNTTLRSLVRVFDVLGLAVDVTIKRKRKR